MQEADAIELFVIITPISYYIYVHTMQDLK